MTNLHLLYPEIALSVMALALLVCDLFVAGRHGRILYHLAWIASAVTLCLVGYTISDPSRLQGVGTLWSVDPLSQFFKMLILATTALCLLLGLEYKGLKPKHAGTFTSLLLLSSAGMMWLVSSIDILNTFISLELISLTSFILTGFERDNPRSTEGGIKYFLFGAFSAGIMAFGISLFYGATGATKLVGLANTAGPVFTLGLLFILLGFGFKASLAPMHFWVADAYQGAPTPVTAYLSLAPKIATLGAMLRLFSVLLPHSMLDLTTVLVILSALTMTVGNFTAIFQTNVKRILAYSSIAQAGYMLIGLVAGNALGMEGIFFYCFVYVAMNLGAFAVLQAVADQAPKSVEDPYSLDAFDGLSQRSLGLALAMFALLISLSGIPPMAGFVAKFYVFSAAVQSGHYWLAAIGLVNSVVSVYYYLRIAYHMFFRPARTQAPVAVGPYLYGSLAVALAGVLLFGFHPQPLVASVQSSAQYLP